MRGVVVVAANAVDVVVSSELIEEVSTFWQEVCVDVELDTVTAVVLVITVAV